MTGSADDKIYIIQKRRKKLKDTAFIWSVLAYPLILFMIFYVYVNINSFVMAFQKQNLDGSKIFIGIENFKTFVSEVASSGGLLNVALKNSVKMYLLNLLICMPLYIFFSYFLFKKYLGSRIIRCVVMIPQVVSSMVIALLFKKIVSDALPEIMQALTGAEFPDLLSEPGKRFGTVLFYGIWVSFSTSLIVYSNAMGEINEEVIESAHIDGIDTMFPELWYIVLPLIYPTLTTFIVVGFAGFLADSGALVTFYGPDGEADVYTLGYYFTVQILRNNTGTYNTIAAGGLLMSLVMAPLTYLLKYCMEKFGPEAE